MDDKEFYYDLAKFEVNMMATRSNFLMVFQSMLFAATASLINKATYIPQWLLICLGLISSILWLYLNMLTNTVSKAAFEEANAIDNRLDKIMKSREKVTLLKIGSNSWIMTYPFPILTTFAWLIFLHNYIGLTLLKDFWTWVCNIPVW